MTPNASLASEQDTRKACAKSGRESATKTVVKKNRKELIDAGDRSCCVSSSSILSGYWQTFILKTQEK